MAIVQTTQVQNNQNVENHNVVDTKTMTNDQVQQVAQQKAASQSTTDASLTQNETNNASNQTKQASNYEANQQSWNNYDQQKQQYVTKSKGDVANQATTQNTKVAKNNDSNVVGNSTTNKDQNVSTDQQRTQNNDARMVQDDEKQVSNVRQNASSNYSVKQTRDNGDSVDAPITDTLPKEQDSAHDSVYHLNTVQGWSNDVQTILYGHNYDTNRYFFLHSVDGATNPFGPSGQDWESVTGNDDANGKFTDAHIALNSHGPSGVADTWKSAWTGSIVESKGDIAGVPNGAEVAYFAGLNASDGSQNIYAAWSSDDGETFTHALNGGHPILAWNMDGASGKKDQERDSYVTYDENGKLLMYTAEGNQLGVYTSTDGIHWTPSGKVGPDQFFKGLKWDDGQNMPIECPQLANMKDSSGNSHIVLLYGDKDPQNGQTTGTYYVVGHLDDHDDFVADYPAHRLDAGSDYYGANIGQVTLDTPVGALDSMGWIGNWNYTSAGVYDNQNSQGKMTPHLGSYSMNRTLSLNDDGTISVELPNDVPHDAGVADETSCSTTHPVFDCEKYPGQTKTVGQDKFGKIYQMYGSNTDGSASMYNFNFHDKDYGSEAYNGNVYLKISQGKDYIIVKYDPTTGDYQVSRYASELNNDMQKTVASSYYYDGALGKGQGYTGNDDKLAAGGSNLDGSDASQFTINVYTDKDSVVIQFPNGTVYTVARYCTNDEQCVDVYTSYINGKMKIERECFNGPATNDKPGYDMPQEPSNNTTVVNPSADNSASDAPIASGSRIKGTDANPVFDSGKTAQEIDAENGTNGESSSSSSSSSSSNKPSDSNTNNGTSSGSTQNKPTSDNSGSTSSSNNGGTSSSGTSSSTSGNPDHSNQPTNNPNDVNHDQTGSSSKPTTGTSSTTDSSNHGTSSSQTGSNSNSSSSGNTGSSSANKPVNGDTGTTSTSKPGDGSSSSTSTNKPVSGNQPATNVPSQNTPAHNEPASGNSGSSSSQTNENQSQSGSSNNQPNSGDSSSSMPDNHPSKPNNGSSSSQDSNKQPVNGSQSGTDSNDNGSSSSSTTDNPVVKPTTGTTSSNVNGNSSTSTSADQSSSNSEPATNGSSSDVNSSSNSTNNSDDNQQVGGTTSSNGATDVSHSASEDSSQSSSQDVANQGSASHTGSDITSNSSSNATNDDKIGSNVGKSSVANENQNDAMIGSNLNQNGSNDNNGQSSNVSSLQQLGSQRGSGLVGNKMQNVGSSTKNDSSMNQNSSDQDLPQTGEMNEGLLMLGMSALLLGTAMLLEKCNKD